MILVITGRGKSKHSKTSFVGIGAKEQVFFLDVRSKSCSSCRGVVSFTQMRTCILEKLVDFLLQLKGICSVVTWPYIFYFFIYWNILCKMSFGKCRQKIIPQILLVCVCVHVQNLTLRPFPVIINQFWREGDQFWSHESPLCRILGNDYQGQNGY